MVRTLRFSIGFQRILTARSLIVLLVLEYIAGETSELKKTGLSRLEYYRIRNDPNQVKPDNITSSNLFSWLNVKNTVKFRLWTRANPLLAHEVKYQNVESLRSSNFDSRRLTKIIIHGFADTATEVAVTYYLFDMRDAYLHLGDVNVFIMDYAIFTLPILYYSANPTLPAIRLAEFINFLVKNSNLKLSSIHLIGFSLGAQVAGLAGGQLKNQIGLVGRITGLDPAGPTFHYVSNDLRLDKSDAQFVDIIHTNGGKRFWSKIHLGIDEATGHADFYPNGGTFQPGCVTPNLECSHTRAWKYFIESITSPLAFPTCDCASFDRFVAGECPCGKNWQEEIYMGEHLNQSVHGKFQLVTNSGKPYGNGRRIDINLPSLPPEFDVRIEKRFKRKRKANEALVIFNNTKINLKYNNTYNSLNFPNDDILKLCFQVFIE